MKIESTACLYLPCEEVTYLLAPPLAGGRGPGNATLLADRRPARDGHREERDEAAIDFVQRVRLCEESLRWEKTSITFEDAPCFRPRLTDTGHRRAKSILSPFSC